MDVYGQDIFYKQGRKCTKYRNDYEKTRINSSMNVLDEIKSIIQNIKKPKSEYLLRFNGKTYEYVWMSGDDKSTTRFWAQGESYTYSVLDCTTMDMVNIRCDLK